MCLLIELLTTLCFTDSNEISMSASQIQNILLRNRCLNLLLSLFHNGNETKSINSMYVKMCVEEKLDSTRIFDFVISYSLDFAKMLPVSWGLTGYFYFCKGIFTLLLLLLLSAFFLLC